MIRLDTFDRLGKPRIYCFVRAMLYAINKNEELGVIGHHRLFMSISQ